MFFAAATAASAEPPDHANGGTAGAGQSADAPGHNKDDAGGTGDAGTATADQGDAATADSAGGGGDAGTVEAQAQSAPVAAAPVTASSTSSSGQVCDGDPSGKSGSGNGANTNGPGNQYQNTCPAGPSQNGNGSGKATGKPCAGCVGNADDKNPPGQAHNGNDANAGYECDRNRGVGKGNPAHTGCTPTNPPPNPPGNPPGTTSVLGTSVSAAAGQPAQVLGVVLTRAPVGDVAAVQLARTGAPLRTATHTGLTAILLGLALLAGARRRPRTVRARA